MSCDVILMQVLRKGERVTNLQADTVLQFYGFKKHEIRDGTVL